KALGEGAATSARMRSITIEKGSAAAVAEALQRMLSSIRENPVNVITPGSEIRKEEAIPIKSDSKPNPGNCGEEEEQGAERQPLVDPQERPSKAGNQKPPVNITAIGNRLIITSDDPEALALAQQMVRLLTTSTGDGEFEVIRLKHASAADAA